MEHKDYNDQEEYQKLEKFFIKQDRKTFLEEMNSASLETLNNKLLALAKDKQDIKSAQRDDEALNALKEEVKEMSAPYRESLRFNDKMARLVSLLIEGANK